MEQSGLAALSSDATRLLLTGDETNQTQNRAVFAAMRELLKRRVGAGTALTVVDATALTPWERRCWIRLAELLDCEIEARYFDTPLEECLRRNQNRARRVPEEAIRRMAQRLIPPSVEEGFQRVTIHSASIGAAPTAKASRE